MSSAFHDHHRVYTHKRIDSTTNSQTRVRRERIKTTLEDARALVGCDQTADGAARHDDDGDGGSNVEAAANHTAARCRRRRSPPLAAAANRKARRRSEIASCNEMKMEVVKFYGHTGTRRRASESRQCRCRSSLAPRDDDSGLGGGRCGDGRRTSDSDDERALTSSRLMRRRLASGRSCAGGCGGGWRARADKKVKRGDYERCRQASKRADDERRRRPRWPVGQAGARERAGERTAVVQKDCRVNAVAVVAATARRRRRRPPPPASWGRCRSRQWRPAASEELTSGVLHFVAVAAAHAQKKVSERLTPPRLCDASE